MARLQGEQHEVTVENRRPIGARSWRWLILLSQALAKTSVSPNHISLLSIPFAIAGGLALILFPNGIGFLLCILCIVGRVGCNLLDGMIAIEGGKKSVAGALYNEFPDRISDSALLIALGYMTAYPFLGWLCALLAALTAYVRVFGGSLKLPQDFRGPMAKSQRMAVVALACLLAIPEQRYLGSHDVFLYALLVIAVGSVMTCITRTRAIVALLKKQDLT